MRLAADDDLHRPLGVGEQPREPLRVAQHQREALVRRHAPCEADREHLGIEQILHPRRRVTVADGCRHPPPRLGDEPALHLLAHAPELGIRHSRTVVPVVGVGVRVAPRPLAHGLERGVHPGRSVDAVGDRRDGHLVGVDARPQHAEHAAAHLAVEHRDAVGVLAEVQAEDGHVEDSLVAAVPRLEAERDRTAGVEALEEPAREEVRDELAREAVDAGRHRRVRGEDRARSHLREGFVEVEAVVDDELRHPLQTLEPGVTLVRVIDVGGGAAGELREDPHRAHTADAEQQLLQQAVLAAAAVQAIGHPAHLVGVRRRLGIEEQQRHAADVGDPDARVQATVARQVERDLDRRTRAVAQQGEAEPVRVEQRIALTLPPVVADRLAEVAGTVEEADPRERDAQVGRALEVVACQDAEPAGVLRQRAVDAELGGEVGDVHRLVALEPLVPAFAPEVGGEALILVADARDELLVAGELVQARLPQGTQHAGGVGADLIPQGGIHRGEQCVGRTAPRPAPVRGEAIERGEGVSQHRADRERSDGLHARDSRAQAGSACTAASGPSAQNGARGSDASRYAAQSHA